MSMVYSNSEKLNTQLISQEKTNFKLDIRKKKLESYLLKIKVNKEGFLLSKFDTRMQDKVKFVVDEKSLDHSFQEIHVCYENLKLNISTMKEYLLKVLYFYGDLNYESKLRYDLSHVLFNDKFCDDFMLELESAQYDKTELLELYLENCIRLSSLMDCFNVLVSSKFHKILDFIINFQNINDKIITLLMYFIENCLLSNTEVNAISNEKVSIFINDTKIPYKILFTIINISKVLNEETLVSVIYIIFNILNLKSIELSDDFLNRTNDLFLELISYTSKNISSYGIIGLGGILKLSNNIGLVLMNTIFLNHINVISNLLDIMQNEELVDALISMFIIYCKSYDKTIIDMLVLSGVLLKIPSKMSQNHYVVYIILIKNIIEILKVDYKYDLIIRLINNNVIYELLVSIKDNTYKDLDSVENISKIVLELFTINSNDVYDSLFEQDAFYQVIFIFNNYIADDNISTLISITLHFILFEKSDYFKKFLIKNSQIEGIDILKNIKHNINLIQECLSEEDVQMSKLFKEIQEKLELINI